jgi:hypothetical protein
MFQRAERKRVFLKIGLMGASGAGKSYSALQLAQGLAEGGPICALDTENGSLSLYSDLVQFDVADIAPPFDPEKYIAAIRAAESAGYKVLIIDSFSHAWKYLLDKKEKMDSRGGRQNNYTNWGPVKAEADRLKDAILQSRIHVIACMRAKTEYSQEGGKVQKVGLAAIQEPDVEYEFTTVLQIGMDHTAQQTKDRTGLFRDRIFRIEPATGAALLKWLDTASDQAAYVPPASTTAPAQTAPGHDVQPPVVRPADAERRAKDLLAGWGLKRADFAAYTERVGGLGHDWIVTTMTAQDEGVTNAEGLSLFVDGLTPVDGAGAPV